MLRRDLADVGSGKKGHRGAANPGQAKLAAVLPHRGTRAGAHRRTNTPSGRLPVNVAKEGRLHPALHPNQGCLTGIWQSATPKRGPYDDTASCTN